MRVNIPVDSETRKKLLKEKAKITEKTGKRITWDQFLLKLIKYR